MVEYISPGNLVFKIGPVSIYSKEELTDDHEPKRTCETHLSSRTIEEIARWILPFGVVPFVGCLH